MQSPGSAEGKPVATLADVLIVGGGPVGLLLGCELEARGLRCRIFEQRPEPSTHSRAIGIHPPSLEILARLGLADDFVREGIRVTEAEARTRHRSLGKVDLSRRAGPFPFVLVLPQPKTEALLRESLHRRAPDALRVGATVVGVEGGEHPCVFTRTTEGRSEAHHARFIVGADGRNSIVRRSLSIPCTSETLGPSYVMADFNDETPLGTRAVIYLADEGLVESFPLPEGKRRWVVEAPAPRREADSTEIARWVAERTGVRLRPETALLPSAFGAEQRLAARFKTTGCALVGDAAHVVSPFGAQGMNLGWQGAFLLAEALQLVFQQRADIDSTLAVYERRQRRAARRAQRRADWNGRLGRRSALPAIRNLAARLMLTATSQRTLAHFFTMSFLESERRRWPPP